MNKLLATSTFLFAALSIYMSFLWYDLVITRDYELQTLTVLELSSNTSTKLLSFEWKGKNVNFVLDKIQLLDSDSKSGIVNKVKDGTGDIWYKSIRFSFQNNKLTLVQ